MKEADKDIVRWYVVGLLGVHHEIKVRDSLRLAGIESYVPMRYEIKRVRETQERKMVPAITGLVFAQTSYNQFQAFALTSRDKVYLRKSTFTNHRDYLTVDDQQMERFMALTSAFQEEIAYYKPEEVTLHEGELVEIQLGTKTYEAEIKRVGGKRSRQLVVEIPDVTTAAITLTPDVMKMITRLSTPEHERHRQQRENTRRKQLEETGRADDRKVRNVEMDKKELTETARRLLFEVTEEHQEDAENHMALLELKRLKARLTGIRGYTPQAEGELALALYLASVKLDTEVAQAEERLRQAIGQLKESSMLRMRMTLYLARLTGDEVTLKALTDEANSWNRLRLTARQQALLEDVRTVSR